MNPVAYLCLTCIYVQAPELGLKFSSLHLLFDFYYEEHHNLQV